MNPRAGIVTFLLSLFLMVWGHNLLPHQHHQEELSPVALPQEAHPHDHDHYHRELFSWLDWLKHQFGHFRHADFGAKHLEHYYVKNSGPAGKAGSLVNALLPEYFAFELRYSTLFPQQPGAPLSRAPDPPDRSCRRGRAPPTG